MASSLQEYSKPEIINALENAANKGVNIEIIHGPTDYRSEEIARLQRENRLSLYPLDERPERHFMVVDGKHVLIEKSHSVRKYPISIITCFHAHPLSDEKSIIFEQMKYRSQHN